MVHSLVRTNVLYLPHTCWRYMHLLLTCTLYCDVLLSSIFQACSTCHHLRPSTTTSLFINFACNLFSIDGRDIRGTGMGFIMVRWGMWGREGLDVYNGGGKRDIWRGSGMRLKALGLSRSRKFTLPLYFEWDNVISKSFGNIVLRSELKMYLLIPEPINTCSLIIETYSACYVKYDSNIIYIRLYCVVGLLAKKKSRRHIVRGYAFLMADSSTLRQIRE